MRRLNAFQDLKLPCCTCSSLHFFVHFPFVVVEFSAIIHHTPAAAKEPQYFAEAEFCLILVSSCKIVNYKSVVF